MSEFDRVKAEAIAGPHYDGIPERAKVGGVWGAMRTAAKEAYIAGRSEAMAERTREVVAIVERYISAKMAADCVRVAFPDAFPKPVIDDEHPRPSEVRPRALR